MGKKIALVWLAVFVISSAFIIIFGAGMVENIRYRGSKQFEVAEIENWQVEHDEGPDSEGIYTIAYKNTIREIARKQNVVICSLEQIAEPAYDGTRILEQMQDKWMKQEYFQATWALVDADTRELLERKYWLDETDEQIASAMNISKDSVRMYLSRARRKALFILDCYKENIL